MDRKEIKEFIELVKVESTYKKFLKKDIIYQLIENFDGIYDKQNYTKEIENPLELVIMFYKNYNLDYYNKIDFQIRTYRQSLRRSRRFPEDSIETTPVFCR